MTCKAYASMVKGLKLKVRQYSGLIPTFAEVTGERLLRGPLPPFRIGLTQNSKFRNTCTFVKHENSKMSV